MVNENKFQADLIEELHEIFPDAIILKNDPNYLQGFPDITILFNNVWAVLETKKSSYATHQPNQDYYISKCDRMSYASFVYPENRKRVLDELQQAFRVNR